MRKILSMLILAVMSSVILGGCSKDDDDITGSMKLTNLSGIDWYDGEVWYSDVPNGDLNGDVDFGTLKVGETKTVKTKGAYFYVCIKNSRGKMQLSKPKSVSSSVTVSASDMY
ncbi:MULTISPECIES: hypothetical protein [Bacteroidales]|jgi:major membrane immunogen (membrane-anchored lipoprotein)|uniref:hypothetical protein n=1 Tax=Bacteroidales TaxID=171549 RepID=UPI000F9B93F4|nr:MULTISPECIES: hypothetical protein [Bacteroidales]ROT13973.1 hypothetical protein EEL51_14285 [Muribaculaceae bacterium Isolate-110 (HZI)]RXE72910.1 hypothetical protein ED551_11275 [Muribaculaceae bacterium Isolate-013 (NCI)]GFI39168.1 hypothetical protein IMSAGC016_00943 [Muribaculaceae bacterium]QCD38109.1 hypothetical protein E7745_00330 [Duncaniella sp. C9]QCP71791.1 hypothetical protein FDZ78_04035 [Duncaniella sp. B8]